MRIFQGGSDAVTRVLIESGDEKGDRWVTIGVSPNIIDASFQRADGFHRLQARGRAAPRRRESVVSCSAKTRLSSGC